MKFLAVVGAVGLAALAQPQIATRSSA